MVGSRLRATTSRSTTAPTSSGRSARRRARRSCTPRREGERGPQPLAPITNHIEQLADPAFLSLIGIGEVVLLPLDVLKIKRQTNPEAFRGRGVLKIIGDEGLGLYRGWGWTAARNAPGSFAVCFSPPAAFRSFHS